MIREQITMQKRIEEVERKVAALAARITALEMAGAGSVYKGLTEQRDELKREIRSEVQRLETQIEGA
jgi:SMC interacting uncharacterized protein involved in chromosome segregation